MESWSVTNQRCGKVCCVHGRNTHTLKCIHKGHALMLVVWDDVLRGLRAMRKILVLIEFALNIVVTGEDGANRVVGNKVGGILSDCQIFIHNLIEFILGDVVWVGDLRVRKERRRRRF